MKKISLNSIFNIVLLIIFCIICAVVSGDSFTRLHLIGYGTTVLLICFSIITNIMFECEISDNNSTLGVAWKIINELLIFISVLTNGLLLLFVGNIKIYIIIDLIIIAVCIFSNIMFKKTNESFNRQDNN